MTGTTTRTESKRTKALRLGLAKQIPKFPNDKASIQSLERKSLGALLIDYANWAIRYVAPRPRKVIIEPAASTDHRWGSLQNNIVAFLAKVERGEDLTPHLSLEPHTRGYTPAASALGPNVDRWADKDMLLNVMGYHHFHLSMTIEPGGFASRTNELIFAHVTRTEFSVVAIFDHSVFECEAGQPLNPERGRLWRIFDEWMTRNIPAGSVVVPAPIATSGHSMHFAQLAMDYARLVSKMDQQVEDPAFVSSLTTEPAIALPANPKWKWHLYYLDLGLWEKTSESFLVFRHGPN